MESWPSVVAAYDGHRLRWRYVVARLPVQVFKVRTEMFGENLLATGEPVATTHDTTF